MNRKSSDSLRRTQKNNIGKSTSQKSKYEEDDEQQWGYEEPLQTSNHHPLPKTSHTKQKDQKSTTRKKRSSRKEETPPESEVEEEEYDQENGNVKNGDEVYYYNDEEYQEGKVESESDGEEGGSVLESLIGEAELLIQDMADDIERLKRMSKAYEEILTGGLFSSGEIKTYRASLTFHRQNLLSRLSGTVEKINSAKQVWQEKQQMSKNMFEQGILDNGVAEQWNSSLVECSKRIDKLEITINFLNQSSH